MSGGDFIWAVPRVSRRRRGKRMGPGLRFWKPFFFPGAKAGVGFSTGSLGILSEAFHLALDLLAAVITWFAVSLSGKPADHARAIRLGAGQRGGNL